MPPIRHPNREHEYPAIEPYPTPSRSLNQIYILNDSATDNNSMGTIISSRVTPSLIPNPAQAIGQPFHNISQGRALVPADRKPSKGPRLSKERPGENSKSVLLKPRPFGKPRKEVHQTYTREFKLQVLSFWLHHKIPSGPTTFRSPTEREVAGRYLVPRTTIQKWRKPDAMELIVNGTKST
ncbi:hypothetical protein HOY82DRAFT_534589 [Tuber indicum]|nr:hypothetical protein HOY82DRAFT_534589 [Tuber indicum]